MYGLPARTDCSARASYPSLHGVCGRVEMHEQHSHHHLHEAEGDEHMFYMRIEACSSKKVDVS
jgi:hypothetical protein